MERGSTPNLSLILGGGGTTLEELVGAYRALAAGGISGKPRLAPGESKVEGRIMSEGAAFIVRDILEAGGHPERPFHEALARPVAWKTGTSFGFRDAWAVGVTDTHTIGVWIGRPDGTPNPGFFGANVAAPLLKDIVAALPISSETAPRKRPADVAAVTVCWPTGEDVRRVSPELCHVKRAGWALAGGVPPTLPDRMRSGSLREAAWIDPASGYRVTPDCAPGALPREIARWPVHLEPWLDASLLRHHADLRWKPGCAADNAPGAGLRIAGLESGAVLRPAPQSHRIAVSLSAVGGAQRVYWVVDGRYSQVTKGTLLRVVFTENGTHAITAFDADGRHHRIEIVVRGLRRRRDPASAGINERTGRVFPSHTISVLHGLRWHFGPASCTSGTNDSVAYNRPVRTLETLNLDHSYDRLPPAFYSRVEPTPLPDPCLVAFNEDAARLIDLDPAEAKREKFLAVMAGNARLNGEEPFAMLYSGHQFGTYVPQLGDGRALQIGEVMNDRDERWALQLKGSGMTPYSRMADGRAVLRSTIREYLCSEAMHGLGIPTTRALCIVGSDEPVYRETPETAAVLLRMAPSHVRFGSFEVFYYRKQHENLALLADHVIETFFPELNGAPDRYHRLLVEVVERTARLIAKWQAVGFSHGVMNTDNMSILGLTLDYGPFGFMERFDYAYICNHSDTQGRYAYGNQPHIGIWNLACLAQALTPIIPVEQCNAALQSYEPVYFDEYSALMRAKLGLATAEADDRQLVLDLLESMAKSGVDYTIFFRALAGFRRGAANSELRDQFIERVAFDIWAERYGARLAREGSNDAEREARMNRVNPRYVLRNYLAQVAIERATGEKDYSEIDRLLHLLRQPFDEQPEMASYASPPPDWAQEIQVSCSS
jgi:hypothetical protein